MESTSNRHLSPWIAAFCPTLAHLSAEVSSSYIKLYINLVTLKLVLEKPSLGVAG